MWTPHKHAYDKGDKNDKGGKKGGESGALGHVMGRTGEWTWCHRCGLHRKNKVVWVKEAV